MAKRTATGPADRLREGMARQRAGDLAGAEACFRKALADSPDQPQALGLLGTVQLQAGHPDRAAATFRRVTDLVPGHADGHHCLGLCLGAMGRAADAEACFRQALARDADHAGALIQLGILLAARGELDEAAVHLERAAALAPESPDPPFHLARVRERQGRLEEARERLAAVVRLAPQHAPAHARLGHLSQARGALGTAVEHFRHWARLEPENPAAHVELGAVHLALGDLDAGIAAFDRALALDPGNERALASKAAALERAGDFDAAYAVIRPRIEGGDPGPDTAAAFASLAPRLGREGEALSLLERSLADGKLHPGARSILHFRAGWLCDRQGAYDPAFAHYQAGNALRGNGFDREAHAAAIDGLIRAFGTGPMGRLPRASHRLRFPVFIVGMPRSGTTLVEQIIASHPAAFGGGERPEITWFTRMLPSLLEGDTPYPACVAGIDRATLDDLVRRYDDALRSLAPGAERITDKMPQNFLHLGLIALLFPAARIIHTVRDARDCCLSCYFQPFVGDHPYAQDLGDLGFYFRQYERLMAHWREVLDLPLLELRYEDLVADPEGHSRRMIDFLELPWDDACLRFHESGRAVATSSYDQVRRPVYRGSAGRWRHYERHLGPLLAALEETG